MSNRNKLAGKSEEILKLYNQGWRQTQLAEHFGVTQSAIGFCLRKLQAYLDSPRRRKWTDFRKQLAKQLYLSGHTQTEVAVILRSNQGRVGEILKSLGVQARDPYRFGSGERNPAWRGGSTITGGYRYIYLPEHPAAKTGHYVLHHRLVMEAHLGRYLTQEEVVHHKNDDTLDNRLSNLQLFANNGEHLAATRKGKLPNWSEEGKRLIAQARRKPRKRKRNQPRPKTGDHK